MNDELLNGIIEMVKQGGWVVIPIGLVYAWIMSGFKVPWKKGDK